MFCQSTLTSKLYKKRFELDINSKNQLIRYVELRFPSRVQWDLLIKNKKCGNRLQSNNLVFAQQKTPMEVSGVFSPTIPHVSMRITVRYNIVAVAIRCWTTSNTRTHNGYRPSTLSSFVCTVRFADHRVPLNNNSSHVEYHTNIMVFITHYV